MSIADRQRDNNLPVPPANIPRRADREARQNGRREVTVGESVTWEPPLPFFRHSLPTFPSHLLPDWIRNFVLALADTTQTPVDLAGMLSLAVLGVACGRKLVVRVRPGWDEPVNVYVVVALPPGERKSAVFSAVVKVLEQWEKEQARVAAPEIAVAQSRYQILEQRLKKAQTQAAKSFGPPAEQAETEAEALACQLAEIVVPSAPRLLVDDCTPERLSTLLRDQRGRLGVMSPEGDLFSLLAGRYSANGAPNFAVFLKGHSGDTLRVDRVGRPAEYVEQPALTLGLAVQPEVIQGLADVPGFRGRGLLGRFLYSIPQSLLGRRLANPGTVPAEVRDTYQDRVRCLLGIAYRFEGEDPVPYPLLLTPEARTELDTFNAWLEPQLAPHGQFDGRTDWAGKLVGAAVRIAGLFHAAECARIVAPWEQALDVPTMRRAITLARDYLIPHALAAFAEMGVTPVVTEAKHLLAWMLSQAANSANSANSARRTEGEEGVSFTFAKRQLFEGVKGRFKTVEEMNPGLELLIEHGYTRTVQSPKRKGPGRSPSPVYELNPYTQNSQNSQNGSHREDGS